MSEVHPILVRVPEPLADRLTAEAADQGCSRHALILDKLQHECPSQRIVAGDGTVIHEWNDNRVAVRVTDPDVPPLPELPRAFTS